MAHFSFVRNVKARPEEVYEWWSNFTPQDHAGPNWPTGLHAERIVVEQDDRHAVIHDKFGRFEIDARITKKRPLALETEGSSRGVKTRGRSTLTATPEGTKLQVDVDMMPHGFAKLMFPLMKGRLNKMLNEDLDGHIKDFYDETGMKP